MRKSWTIQFLKEWYPRVNFTSVVRLRRQVLRAQNGTLRPGNTLLLKVKHPFQASVVLREWGSDLATFEEIVAAEIYRSVAGELDEPKTIIDLGANVGLASLYFTHHWPSCHILAVEPNPETYKILVTNLACLSRQGRCKTLQAAVWDTAVTLSAKPHQEPGRYSSYSLCETSGAKGESTSVKGLPLEEIIECSRFKTVDLLKIDVEGAEVRLFNGNTDWLSRISNIAIEFHEDSRKVSKFDEITGKYGFRCHKEGRHTVLASKCS